MGGTGGAGGWIGAAVIEEAPAGGPAEPPKPGGKDIATKGNFCSDGPPAPPSRNMLELRLWFRFRLWFSLGFRFERWGS